MARMVERNPDTEATDIDGEIFLIKVGTEDIHHLDPIASGLWRLLESPADHGQLESVFAAAFPEIPTTTIHKDLASALARLIEVGYLRLQPNRAGEE